jgi:endonuclease/exonuclease/phosphatase family metal-dependent hydrolase
MRRWLAGLVFVSLSLPPLFAIGQSSPSATPAAPSRITVAFWNIQWFPGGRPNATRGEEFRQIKAVRHDVAELHPDILGMEEVRDFRQAGVAVKDLAGFKVDVCANFPPREGQTDTQETAIASRLSPLSAWTEPWKSNGAMLPPRGFAFATYEVAPGQLLFVYCVHLKSNRGADLENVAMREESMRQLRTHIEQMKAAYAKLGHITCVVGGDFNTSLDDTRFSREKTLRDFVHSGFSWALQDLSPNARNSLPAGGGFPAASFDHIFYREAKLERAWIGNISPHASDHRPVAAAFEFGGSSGF